MHPILFRLGPLVLHTYGLFVALGVFLGTRIAIALAVREGMDRAKAQEGFFQLMFWSVLTGIAGARLFYIFLEAEEYSGNWLDIFKIWQGGLVFYGGLIGAVAGFLLWKRSHRDWPWRRVADWIAPALAFGHASGRLGCFFAGCCYGRTADLPWAVVFSDPDSLAPTGVPLHPAQLYEFLLLNALGFFLLWRLLRSGRAPQLASGGVFAEYLMLYALGRFGVEFFRGDLPRTFGLTIGQITSVPIFLAGLVFKMRIHKNFFHASST